MDRLMSKKRIKEIRERSIYLYTDDYTHGDLLELCDMAEALEVEARQKKRMRTRLGRVLGGGLNLFSASKSVKECLNLPVTDAERLIGEKDEGPLEG